MPLTKLHALPDTLAQKYNELKHFFDLSGDLFCIAGFDGYFKMINPAVAQVLGYTEAELLARPINEFVYKDDKNLTTNSRNHVYGGKALRNFENRYQTKTGEIVWLAWTSIPDVQAKRVYAVAKDVTAKKLEEEKRDLLIAQLTQINDNLKVFTQMSSHDMRSPVNNLLAISDLLTSSAAADPKILGLIELLKSTSEHLNHTVNHFLDTVTAPKNLNVQLEVLNLQEVYEEVKRSIGSLIIHSLAEITVDFSACATVLFNKAYLSSIFLNLMTNAIKYAKPNTIPKLSIESGLNKGQVQLIFTDEGVGFDMEQVKDKVFKLHQVFNNKIDSRGVGLHLVHHHVTSLGGSISLVSSLDQGAQFTLTFQKN